LGFGLGLGLDWLGNIEKRIRKRIKDKGIWLQDGAAFGH
jgi:hypothetical protein